MAYRYWSVKKCLKHLHFEKETVICEAAIRSLKNELLVEEYAEHSNIYPSANFRQLSK